MIELRFNNLKAELRQTEYDSESRHIVGYALKFNELSEDLGGFTEIISPGSLEGVIERSDVLALLDHNRERGVLARSRYGEGSLTLSVDEIGLRYEFDAPNTALGNEVVESIRRGDLSASSFGFKIAEDGDKWEKRDDGSIRRTITQIDRLFDVSPVYNPAYQATQVDVRGLEKLNENLNSVNNMTDDIEKFAELQAQLEELRKKIEERESTADNAENVEEKSCGNDDEKENREDEKQEEENEKREENNSDDNESEDAESEDREDESSDENTEENEKRFNININVNTMKKEKFSLRQALNDMVEGRSMSDATAVVHEAGVAEMRKSNLNTSKGLVLPLSIAEEQRSTLMATQATLGQETVASDWMGIYAGLREALVFDKLGCTTLTGLTGNLVFPAYTNTKAYWKSESSKADDGAGTFSTKECMPLRLTAMVNVSRQLLLQDSTGVEAMLTRDIVEALAYEWQKQIFSDDAGTVNVKPAGIFNGVVADTNPLTFEDIVLMEQTLKHDNIPGNYKYLMSTSAEAITRTTRVDAGSGIMIQNNDTINGIPVVSSGIVQDKGIILGNFSELINCIWSGISLEIDKYTHLDEDIIRIVSTIYVNSIVRRDNAFVKKILA